MSMIDRKKVCLAAFAAIGLMALAGEPALAQLAHRPFAVAGGEGGGNPGGVTGWLLAVQAQFSHAMTSSVKALHDDPSALWGLMALSFGYGVFHAAGPGHGKALVASYMLANERALRRGLVLSFLAALLQAFVAIGLVGVAALIFNATSTRMTQAANFIELASYCGIACIGAWLIWKKGRAFIGAVQSARHHSLVLAQGALYADAPWRPAMAGPAASQFRAAGPAASLASAAECGHDHAVDPALLGDGFSWRGAGATVLAAGARPCSGAILVLVFALAQGIFSAGIAATLAMALGTAITTGALASLAVFAKAAALRFARGEASRMILIARGLELLAAFGVLAVGLGLLLGASGGA
jgi:nickel/cobalt transporter (NicO) family protein